MAGYNPNTYPYYQCDEEDYNSNDSPEEQAEMAAARQRHATSLLAAMREAVSEVPSYVERYAREAANLAHEESESEILHERMAQDNPAYATAEEVALMDLYDN